MSLKKGSADWLVANKTPIVLKPCSRCKRDVEEAETTAGGRPQRYLRKHKAICGLPCMPKSQGKIWDVEVHYSMKGCPRCAQKVTKS
jgi:hypothetical protein